MFSYYNYRINLDEEKEAKELITSLKEHCSKVSASYGIAYVTGFLSALQEHSDKYGTGYTNMQIMYVGFYMFKWLSEKAVKESKETK